MSPPPLVLLYHSIADVPRASDPHGLTVSPERFRSQLERVRSRGYEFVTARELARRLRAGDSLHGVCAVTLDDGVADNAEIVPEVLRSLGVPATLYICAGLLGGHHPDYPPESGVRMMSADQLRDVAAEPLIEIGSHTDTHVVLEEASEDEAGDVMARSRHTLEGLIGEAPATFAYPRGAYSPGCPAAAERAGYVAAFTCGPDRGAWRPYELPRVIVESGDRGTSLSSRSGA